MNGTFKCSSEILALGHDNRNYCAWRNLPIANLPNVYSMQILKHDICHKTPYFRYISIVSNISDNKEKIWTIRGHSLPFILNSVKYENV